MDYSFTSLHTSKDAGDFLRHHGTVVDYHTNDMARRKTCHDFAINEHYTDEERAVYKRKRKAPITFPGQLAPMRTIIGQFIQSKYDMKPAPVEPTDQATADPLVAMYHWTRDTANVKHKDIALFKEVYVGGSANQESYVEIIHGKKPRICVTNQNNFAIYWDPDSRDLIGREDAQFVDRETFLTAQDLMDRFPEKAAIIKEAMADQKEKERGGYDKPEVHADRGHENASERNGRFKCVERFYRVSKRLQFGVPREGAQGERMDIGEDITPDTAEGFQKDYPDYVMQSQPMEYMYYAVACEQVSLREFLFNQAYHAQYRDPRTGKILWTIQECVAESLGGRAMGFIEPEIGPLKIIDAMMSNILHATKHAVNGAMFVDPTKFRSETEYQDFVKNGSDSDRRFPVAKGMLDGGQVPAMAVPQSVLGDNNTKPLEYASQMLEESSSAPQALRGATENSGTPASQTEMRIQQSFTQLLGLITNWKYFLTKRAKLWYAMWREFFPFEMQLKVIEKKDPNAPDFMTVNEPIGIDPMGNIVRANDINAAEFDITFEESVESPTTKEGIRTALVQVMNMAAQLDPVMAAWLVKRIVELTDIPQEDKDFLNKHMQVVQAQQQQEQQAAQMQAQTQATGAQMEQDQQLQTMAQAEAEQTTLPPPNPGPPQFRDQALQPA